jgi:hypothetical protein
MEKHEQLDSFQFDIINLCTDVQDKLSGVENEKVLTEYNTSLNMKIRHYISEFDINMYEAAGMLEAIKLDLLLDPEKIAPDVIGCIDTAKIAILLETEVAFEGEELEELDDDDLEELF